MKLLFVHQNMPGQYRELLNWLVAHTNHEIAFLTQRENIPRTDKVLTQVYKPHRVPGQDAYGLSRVWEQAAGAGYGAALAARALQADHGFKPDIVIGHVGWGELTFFKDVWPEVPIIGYFEYFYRLEGGLVGYDNKDEITSDTGFLLRARNTVPLVNIETVDLAQCPTYWQRDRFPSSFHDRMYVCHDGIRTDVLTANPDASLSSKRLKRTLTRDDEIVTYVARNLETARGFHVLMRALPRIQRARPNARVLIVGGDGTSYGSADKSQTSLRRRMQDEVGADLDMDRLHFLGRVPYASFRKILQISRCHIYLTKPFVLSWSVMEAMAMQATIVASDVAPVREMITHDETGMLVDFLNVDAVADQVIDVLKAPKDYAHLGPAARTFIQSKHDFVTRCLPEHLRQINGLVPKALTIEIPT
ncbi:MAG: glycosyltransferase [Roseobacter sp.]